MSKLLYVYIYPPDKVICVKATKVTWWVVVQNSITHADLEDEGPQQLFHVRQQCVWALNNETTDQDNCKNTHIQNSFFPQKQL